MLQKVLFAAAALASLVAAQSNFSTPRYLRVKTINSTNTVWEGYYLSTYHQGAGFADATLVANTTEALGGAFLNATANVTLDYWYLDFNTTIAAGNETIYYSAQIQSTGGYNSMDLMTVNIAAAPIPGFSFDTQGRLAFENTTLFAACNWTHAVRLFISTLLTIVWLSFCVLAVSLLRRTGPVALQLCQHRAHKRRPILLEFISPDIQRNVYAVNSLMNHCPYASFPKFCFSKPMLIYFVSYPILDLHVVYLHHHLPSNSR